MVKADHGSGRPEGAADQRIHDVIARDLGMAIINGDYTPGEMLAGEHEASSALNVSRPAYREAIRTLAAKGLVQSRPKAGTSVCGRDQWNVFDPDVLSWLLKSDTRQTFLEELFELRAILEPGAASLAARRRTPNHLRTMARALTDMERNEPDSPLGEFADRIFHETLLTATGNEMLIKLASIISVSVGYIAEFKRERSVPRDSRPDHEALYRAIEQKRPAEARTVMLRLIEHAREDTSEG